METDTCVRHALAKALYQHARAYEVDFDNKPRNLLNLLLTVRQDKGAGGANPLDWDGKVIT